MASHLDATPRQRTPCFLVDSPTIVRQHAALPTLEIAESVSFLYITGDQPAISSGPCADAIRLQPIFHGQQMYLALANESGLALRVNGLDAGPIAVAKIRDQLEVGREYLLHVTICFRPFIGVATAVDAGRECAICLTRIEAGATIYKCVHCQAAFHYGDGGPGALECVQLASACICCGGSIEKQEGFSYVPI